MQSSAVDKKISILWDKYRDNAVVQELSDDVESIRR